MKTYIVQTVKHVSPRSGAETILTMYCTKEQIQAFFDMLGNDRNVVDSKVVFSIPKGVKSFKSVL